MNSKLPNTGNSTNLILIEILLSICSSAKICMSENLPISHNLLIALLISSPLTISDSG